MHTPSSYPYTMARRLPLWLLALALLLAAGAAAAQSITKPVVSSMTVPLSGKATTKTEPVNINGTARVRTTVVPDLDWRATPVVILTVEFLSMTATGTTSGGRYTVEQTIQKLRTLAATDTVEVTFPIVRMGSGAAGLTTPMIGSATFKLTFNTSTGVLSAASGTVATSTF